MWPPPRTPLGLHCIAMAVVTRVTRPRRHVDLDGLREGVDVDADSSCVVGNSVGNGRWHQRARGCVRGSMQQTTCVAMAACVVLLTSAVSVSARFEADDGVAVENAWKKAVETEPTMPPPMLSPSMVYVISTISAVSVLPHPGGLAQRVFVLFLSIYIRLIFFSGAGQPPHYTYPSENVDASQKTMQCRFLA